VESLDLIEDVQHDGDRYHPEPCCPWCFALPEEAHEADCKAALLLRKHGRKVRFQGEP